MNNRINRARINLEDKLSKLVWRSTLNKTGVVVSTYRNRVTGLETLIIDTDSETLVIKQRDGKLLIKNRTETE